jgi:hypothetical protein
VWLFLNREERKVRKGLKRFFFALLACFAVNSVCNSSNHTIKGDCLKLFLLPMSAAGKVPERVRRLELIFRIGS